MGVSTLCTLISLITILVSSQAFTHQSKTSTFVCSACLTHSRLSEKCIPQSFRPNGCTSRYMSKKHDEDFPPIEDDEYAGEIDWDAEWKKVVTNKDQPKERPGQYKTELEIAATKAKVAAEKTLVSVQQETRKMTNFNSLKGDWKFWIGVLAIISVGTSLISAAGQTSYSNDSFYI